MCGIAGIFKFDGGGISHSLLENMTDLLKHRGPDARGFWYDDHLGLGHRRLAIIDLEGGIQPMSDPSDRFHLTYNGEIYNFPQLKKILEAKGHRFRTKSDTEVLLHCYIEYGERCPEKLNGMFAFAIWDSQQKTLFLARDRLGIKPLFYAQFDQYFIFASEIKSLLAHPALPRRPNFKVMGFYLSHYQSIMEDETLFEGIYSLPPGYCLTLTPEKFRRHRYWILPVIPESDKTDKGEMYYVAAIRECLEKAVERQTLSDVPVGAYLSGGLDSSILVALMSGLNGGKVKTFSVGFPSEEFNEFHYADLVASAYNTDHTQITIEAEDYFLALRELIRYKDAPLSVPNEVPLYLMSKVLRDSITVVLSGEGSDELFAGYGVISRSPFDYLRSLPGSEVPQNQRKLLQRALLRLYGKCQFENELDHFISVYSWIKQGQFDLIFQPQVLRENRNFTLLRDFWRRQFIPLKPLDLYNKYLYLMESVHLPGLLGRLDTTTMAASVEGRVPFTDTELIDLVMKIPFQYKLRWNSPFYENMCARLNAFEIAETMDTTKYILKRSFIDRVPPEVVFRKKYAFPVPLNEWFANEMIPSLMNILADNCPDFINPEGVRNWISQLQDADRALKIWMLLNLLTWYQLYFSPVAVDEHYLCPQTAC